MLTAEQHSEIAKDLLQLINSQQSEELTEDEETKFAEFASQQRSKIAQILIA